MKLGILNTSILTTAGDYTLRDITLEEAKEWVHNSVIDSAIGHSATAEIMSELLGVEIPMNRQLFVQQVGQKALVYKLFGRPREGCILSRDEIEKMGYKFQMLVRVA